MHTHTLPLTTSPSNIVWQTHARPGPGKHSREALRLPREGVASRPRGYSATVGDRYGGRGRLAHVHVHNVYVSETKVADLISRSSHHPAFDHLKQRGRPSLVPRPSSKEEKRVWRI